MIWKCLYCGDITSPGFYFCSRKHAKQLYSRLMHERATLLDEFDASSCFICGKKEVVQTNLDNLTFEEFEKRPSKSIVLFFESRFENHHTSRIPEKTIKLCVKCHRGVELGTLRPDLKPEISRKEYVKIVRTENLKKEKKRLR